MWEGEEEERAEERGDKEETGEKRENGRGKAEITEKGRRQGRPCGLEPTSSPSLGDGPSPPSSSIKAGEQNHRPRSQGSQTCPLVVFQTERVKPVPTRISPHGQASVRPPAWLSHQNSWTCRDGPAPFH